MAKTPTEPKKTVKKPAAKQVRDNKLQVNETDVGKIKAGYSPSPNGSPTWSP